MVATDTGYSLIQEVQSNKIVIMLPQTGDTLTNSVGPVSSRKLMLSQAEESALLQIVVQLFESADAAGVADCRKEN